MITAEVLGRAGVPHGFSTRGDDEAGVARSLGLAPERVFRVSQVHGRGVRVVRVGDRPDAVRGVEADALVACTGGDAVRVATADCVPILLADLERGFAAAVHAGWRGTVAGVLDAALDALEAEGARPGRLVAAIGPHIRACCFEVGDDVANQLEGAGAVISLRGLAPNPHADLASVHLARLSARGVGAVEDVGGCTRCEPDRFYSYRRDGKGAGRQVALVAAVDPPRPVL